MPPTEGNDTAHIPPHIAEEIRLFEEQADLYMKQVVGEKEFTPTQRLHGVYGQSNSDRHMVRIKIPSGILTAEQVAILSDVVERFDQRQVGHITTRQNVQIYGVKLEDTPEVMRQLAPIGLTTREACGNTVRNVKCCPFAGLHPTAPFDPTPYALAATEKFLRNDEIIAVREDGEKTFFKLPRKFKISFGGCCGDEDCGQAAINDIGLLAALRHEGGRAIRGFELRVGGGLAAQPREATVLVDFVPGDEVLIWIEAVLRVFAGHGNYDMSPRGRAHARLKYVIWEKGWEWFKEEVYRVRATLPAKEPIDLPPDETGERSASTTGGTPVVQEFHRWLSVNTRPQRQDGFRACYAAVPLGDLSAEQWRQIGRMAGRWGDGTVRLTDQQNLLFRWVRDENAANLYADLRSAGLAEARAGLVGDVTSCPGADTCRLGITSSKGLTRDLRQFLDGEGESLASDADVGQIHIKISGCPNSCAQHQLATIGLHGGSQTMMVHGQKKQIPAAMLVLGGRLGRAGASFARKMLVLPARKVRLALPLLAELYRETRSVGETFEAWAQRIDKALVVKKLEPLTKKDPADPDLFIDAGKTEAFVHIATA